ncbi:efflux RND transporter periplasmic adaptor subunit [Chryseobacterium gotjawalense]|uniref:Efflux RND transporter periplasmic adaptor subunit n=1 Tax=Chryseobacterium gotjawalense TaxID=3042315 RepID=A0ABY8RGY4_9FLAO|nr:efflux RND transporter periplasmic adaptor subunit [Chryseobacterium sp. wdc7]WHF52433.1 efflux RND transporter periplasmic adaptor subunit [Chryseobacterium sp. wdc7]
MKNKKWLIGGILILVLGIGLWYYFKKSEAVKIQLNTVKPIIGDITESITATGTIQPVDTVAVGTQVSGTLNKIYVDFNSQVKKGQLLATLDPALLRDQSLQIAGTLASAKSNLVFSQTAYNRQAALYKVGAVSKADFQSALNQYNAAKAQISAITAQLSAANTNLSYTKIYSPIDGTILSRNVSEGQTVAASFSTPTLFSIAKDLTKMQVRASIDEADIGNVKAGQNVTFTVDAFPDLNFKGKIVEIRLHPTVSANVVNYITIINTENSELKLKPGMTANISVITSDLPNVMKIPVQAVTFKPDSLVASTHPINSPYNITQKKQWNGQKPSANKTKPKEEVTVWILEADQSLSMKKIKTGTSSDTELQVISGLSLNDNVITGYKTLSKKSGSAAKSPFLPQRSGGNRPGSGGGPR